MARTSQMSKMSLSLFILIIATTLLLNSSQVGAKEFHVGGKDGWVEKPSEDYNHWAQRSRFQVNDTLNFKYKKGANSVLVVKREDYDSCNTNNPIFKMDNGDSFFLLDKSGLFYFISGNVEDCKKGQKLIILVMSDKHSISLAPASPPHQEIHKGESDSPAPSPSKASAPTRLGVGVGLVFILMANFVVLV